MSGHRILLLETEEIDETHKGLHVPGDNTLEVLVSELALLVEVVPSSGHGDLGLLHWDHVEANDNGPKVVLGLHGGAGSWVLSRAGTHDSHRLPTPAGGAVRPAAPVNGVLERAWDGVVELRGDKQDAIGGHDLGLEVLHRLGEVILKVLVVEGKVRVVKNLDLDTSRGVLLGGIEEKAVERSRAKRPADPNNLNRGVNHDQSIVVVGGCSSSSSRRL